MNKLFTILTLFCCFVIATLSSQTLQTVPKVGLGINGLDFSVEIPLAKNITIEPAIGFGPSYDFSDKDALTKKMDWHWALLEPSVHTSIYGKFFYSRNNRISKGKSKLFNLGHFIGLKVKYVSKPLTNDEFHGQTNTLLANLNWGAQRNLGSRWNYSYSVGLGYGRNLDYSYGTFYPAFDLKIDYVLPFWGGK